MIRFGDGPIRERTHRKVIWVLDDQAARGQVLKFTDDEVWRCYPNLAVASLAAQRKVKPTTGYGERTYTNPRPGAGAHWRRCRTLGAGEGKAAREHIRIKGWRIGSAQAGPCCCACPQVWNFCRGLSVLLLVPGCVSPYLVGNTAHTWHMLVADDCHLKAGPPSNRPALMVLSFLCMVCGFRSFGTRPLEEKLLLGRAFSSCVKAIRWSSRSVA